MRARPWMIDQYCEESLLFLQPVHIKAFRRGSWKMTCLGLDGAGGKQSFAALPFPWRSRSGTGPRAVHWLEAWGYGKPRRPSQHVVT